jgi:hypothetical protein
MADPIESVVELAALIEALFEGDPPLADRAALCDVHAAPEQRFGCCKTSSRCLTGRLDPSASHPGCLPGRDVAAGCVCGLALDVAWPPQIFEVWPAGAVRL